MNAVAESSIEFLCAFDVSPICNWLAADCTPLELHPMYLRHMCARVEAAINHLESIPSDMRAARHLERLSELYFHVNAAELDKARRGEHLFNASTLLDAILAERGDR